MSSEVLARCTRNGVTSWSNVAKQLGLSVDQARSRHDPEYLKPAQPEEVRNAA